MANKKQILTKKQTNKIKKAAKKNPKLFLIGFIILFIVAAGAGAGYYFYKKNHEEDHTHETIQSGEVQINFLELGNDKIGDSTFIKVGDVDILIDAGSRESSAETIENYMKTKMNDDTIEYVISTHAHQDHIAGFVGTKTYGGIFDHFKVGTLIQFSKTNQTDGQLYTNYLSKVENLKNNGTKVYAAHECINTPFEIDNKITLKILDQKYYYENSSSENNYSVCAMLNQGDNHYLFTGDLEKAGEKSLVEKNNLPHCQLFKGGHHGSETSNNDELLSVIRPETICICTCCGSTEYTKDPLKVFPAQVVCDRIAKYTKYIYVTGSVIDGSYVSMNGNITFKCSNGVDYEVHGSNNDTILKDTDWFKANRTWNETSLE